MLFARAESGRDARAEFLLDLAAEGLNPRNRYHTIGLWLGRDRGASTRHDSGLMMRRTGFDPLPFTGRNTGRKDSVRGRNS